EFGAIDARHFLDVDVVTAGHGHARLQRRLDRVTGQRAGDEEVDRDRQEDDQQKLPDPCEQVVDRHAILPWTGGTLPDLYAGLQSTRPGHTMAARAPLTREESARGV